MLRDEEVFKLDEENPTIVDRNDISIFVSDAHFCCLRQDAIDDLDRLIAEAKEGK